MWYLLPTLQEAQEVDGTGPSVRKRAEMFEEVKADRLLTFHFHLQPSLPLPASAELWQGAPGLGLTPPLRAGYGGSEMPLLPQPGGKR